LRPCGRGARVAEPPDGAERGADAFSKVWVERVGVLAIVVG
jgi:hypothetical protein